MAANFHRCLSLIVSKLSTRNTRQNLDKGLLINIALACRLLPDSISQSCEIKCGNGLGMRLNKTCTKSLPDLLLSSTLRWWAGLETTNQLLTVSLVLEKCQKKKNAKFPHSRLLLAKRVHLFIRTA